MRSGWERRVPSMFRLKLLVIKGHCVKLKMTDISHDAALMLSIDSNEISQQGTEEVNVLRLKEAASTKVYALNAARYQRASSCIRCPRAIAACALAGCSRRKGAFVSNEAQLRARERVLC